MKRNDIRKQFKNLGYKISFRSNPLNRNIVSLQISVDGMPDQIIKHADANVFDRETYDQHRQAFELVSNLKNTILSDTNQKIVS